MHVVVYIEINTHTRAPHNSSECIYTCDRIVLQTTAPQVFDGNSICLSAFLKGNSSAHSNPSVSSFVRPDQQSSVITAYTKTHALVLLRTIIAQWKYYSNRIRALCGCLMYINAENPIDIRHRPKSCLYSAHN